MSNSANNSKPTVGNAMQSIVAMCGVARNREALISQLDLYRQLICVEALVEKNRLSSLFAYGAMFLLLLLCFILFTGILAIGLSWDTQFRAMTLFGVVIVDLLGLGWVGLKVRTVLRTSSRSFSATRAELVEDWNVLRGRS